MWHEDEEVGHVEWSLIGRHNAENALAAIAAAEAADVDPACSCRSMAAYRPVRRRLQKLYSDQRVVLYDDFAHHPTAIRATLNALTEGLSGTASGCRSGSVFVYHASGMSRFRSG